MSFHWNELAAAIISNPALTGASAARPGLRASLNVWGHFAELATALGLAYANLPAFRYRDKVREHILRVVTADAFAVNLVSYCQRHPDSVETSILIRMGRLSSSDLASPDFDPSACARSEKWWRGKFDVVLFRSLFSTNVDKIVCVILAIIAGWVLWFGALDEMAFPDPVAGDPARQLFFTCLLVGCSFTVFFTFFSYVCFLTSRRWIHVVGGFLGVLAVLSFFGASIRFVPFAQAWSAFLGDTPTITHHATAVYLLVATFIPMFLVVMGDWAKHRMTKMADECADTIRQGRGLAASAANLGDLNPPAHAQPLQQPAVPQIQGPARH
jgi:hypothetical protein